MAVTARKQRTIDALLDAAERIYADSEPDAVTVEQIAAEAGVTVPTIYNHFGSKAGLYVALVERALDTNREYMDRAYADGRSALERVYAAGDEYLNFYLDHPEFFRMLAFPPDPGRYPASKELSQRLARRVDEQNSRLAEALEECVEQGLMRPMDTRAVARFLWAGISGVISLAWRPDALRMSADEIRELLHTATEIVATGLLVREQPADAQA
jgi:AcrR family transcriptional regulator